jgi:tetratricopeptide (TPR) repeat protein
MQLELQLVFLEPLSWERDKYVWQDRDGRPWDEIIGRMCLLKANEALEEEEYMDALAYFEQGLVFLAKDGVDRDYYVRALADKALVQCFLAEYEAALATIDQALAVSDESDEEDDYDEDGDEDDYDEDDEYDRDATLKNRGAILVLMGAYENALKALSMQLDKDPKNEYLRFTWATCLLHLERYQEAIVAYEDAIAADSSLQREGLDAARLGQQPDWANL